ncbi:Serine/threonine phosphatase stp [Jeotgalibaca dankookensis]|uniref:protein-serine/threonine phosphatase n=1 Tax=Jeotgalibaca dankookensis TaxID=708126 RepID=A0A1S6IN65_9LACT|nr:Stp1/IreP family PP2C-type Ser/Thr phosphatase [Jeotgalibaca dankookensis]AQS52941.1 Serine/threonine phosphatase stp [Jeotgalibaca dankookensis]
MQIAFKSDIGKSRTTNEDYVNWFENSKGQLLMILCDGMGGHLAGDVASEMAVSHMGEAWKETAFDKPENVSTWLLQTIQKINRLIFQKSLDFIDLDGMGTTLVAAAYVEGEITLAHVGDSRAYLYRDFLLKQLTEDHSLVSELIKFGEITYEEAEKHPQRNYITRAVGMKEKILIDLTTFTMQEGDTLILCTDGLSSVLSTNQIKHVLKGWHPIKEKTKTLVDLANKEGGPDNISVLIAEVGKGEEGRC